MAKGEIWFWLLKISGLLQFGGLIALFFVIDIFHMDWSSSGGPYGDSLTGYFMGYLFPLGFTIMTCVYVGFNIGHSAGEFIPYLLGYIFGGAQLLCSLWSAILTAARAGTCGSSASVYCTDEKALLVWFAVVGFGLLLAETLMIVCLAMLQGRRASYQSTHYKMGGTASRAMPATASNPVKMFQPTR